MPWIKSINVMGMLRYGVDYYNFIYEGDVAPSYCAFSPASAYLFGEHSDYNRGYAMSLTLPLIIMVLVGFNDRKVINIASDATTGKKLVESYQLKTFEDHIKDAPQWTKITLWALCAFKDKLQKGINIAFVSNIPIGIGLGSSTAMCTAIFTVMERFGSKFMRDRPKIKMCRDIEIHGSHTLTGFAQPTVAFCAEVGYVLNIDCKTLLCTYLPMKHLPVIFIITTSGTERLISETDFKKRMEECETAAQLLGVNSLGELTTDLLRRKKGVISNTLHKRATHVVEEAVRVYEASLAVKRRDFTTFGLMMLKSHFSLKENMEVSCEDIDRLVELAMACPGVYGSKLSGVGFGGCTITLMERKHVKEFVELMEFNYGGECNFIAASAWGSTTEISFELNEYLNAQRK